MGLCVSLWVPVVPCGWNYGSLWVELWVPMGGTVGPCGWNSGALWVEQWGPVGGAIRFLWALEDGTVGSLESPWVPSASVRVPRDSMHGVVTSESLCCWSIWVMLILLFVPIVLIDGILGVHEWCCGS